MHAHMVSPHICMLICTFVFSLDTQLISDIAQMYLYLIYYITKTLGLIALPFIISFLATEN